MTSEWSNILEELRIAARDALPTIGDVPFEIPPDIHMGDLAVPCHGLAKVLHQSPVAIAERIAEHLGAHPLVERVEVMGLYANITLDAATVARRILVAVDQRGGQYGTRTTEQSKTTVLEFVSPNTNKPLHLGHLRNAFLGESIARLLESQGETVHRVCLNNDRGIHIMKSQLAYDRWGDHGTPDSAHEKGDHFVGRWYVEFAKRAKEDAHLDDDAKALLRSWEAGDRATRELWERMTAWVMDGFEQTYKLLGIRFDRSYRESAIYERGKAIVATGLERSVFHHDEKGNVIARLEDRYTVPDKVVERADGTTVYATQDLALAEAKAKDFAFDRSIILTGSEQELYFQQLFSIFDTLGHPGAGVSHHVSYGMVLLPEGKMKSREGTVVDADDLISTLTDLATREILARATLPDEGRGDQDVALPPPVVPDDASERAEAIALAAIRFYLLFVTPSATVTFNPAESLAFTGKTGPYLQYMHARMCAIMRNDTSAHTKKKHATYAHLLIHPAEKQLLLRIARFPNVVGDAATALNPSLLAQFLYDFAKSFADFYRDVPVNQADGDLRLARHGLLDVSRHVLASGLKLLGITPLERM